MSGICGLFNLDHAPVVQSDIGAMTSMLEIRGPERTGRWQDASIGLGHTLLGTTPELLFEQQPFVHSESACVITADVRLDNRDDLFSSLKIGRPPETVGDAELILNAYLSWGEDCLDHLVGDFAFAIWDPRQQRLFCARDHFGMRPFYYHRTAGKQFAFASDPRAILVLSQVPYAINDGRVADFLVPELQWSDYTSTFYEGVFRLPPGHRAIVTPTRLDIAEYWHPHPGPDPGPMSDDDYRQGFLDVMTEAVRCRLRAPKGTVGSMLSGGMDSGSVVAIAKQLLHERGEGPLHTYSAVRPRDADLSDCPESRAIYTSMDTPWIFPTALHPDSIEALHEQLLSGNAEPFDSEFAFLKAIYLTAREQGKNVLLDGAAGDVVLAEGTYINRMIRAGRFKRVLAEIKAETDIWEGRSILPPLYRYARGALLPEAIKRPLRHFRNGQEINKLVRASLISPEFAERVNMADRYRGMRKMFSSGWTPDYATERCNAIRPSLTAGRERYARIAAAAGMEARDPFLDKRVVEFCSRLPGRFRLKDGWPKIILRQIMADKLPQEVLWTRRKPHVGWLFNEAIANRAVQRGDFEIEQLETVLTGYVDTAALARAWQEYRENDDAAQIFSAHLLSIWLQETLHRPVVPG